MIERIIEIEQIDPQLLFGAHNRLLNRMTDKFPDLKVVARGQRIKIQGDTERVELFENRLNNLTEYIRKFGHASEETVDQVFDTPTVTARKKEEENLQNVIVYGNNGLIVRARTPNQQRLVEAYEKSDLIFATGPAGTGKTYTAIALAVRALRNKEVRRIILTRPAVEAGEKLGFLPGDMKEKLDPYLQPLYDGLNDMIPAKKLETFIEDGTVQIAPLAYMRGRTLDNAFVILDEAQNTTREQLKMFLTRMGRNAKFIVNGDMTQIDLPNRRDSGLAATIALLKPIEGVGFIEFDQNDIVRHPLVAKIVSAFGDDAQNQHD